MNIAFCLQKLYLYSIDQQITNSKTLGPLPLLPQWTPRETLQAGSVAGALSLEVDVLKERLQRQTDVAVRAQQALTQLAASTTETQATLLKQAQDAQRMAEAAAAGRRELEDEYERLRQERLKLRAEVAAAQVIPQ